MYDYDERYTDDEQQRSHNSSSSQLVTDALKTYGKIKQKSDAEESVNTRNRDSQNQKKNERLETQNEQEHLEQQGEKTDNIDLSNAEKRLNKKNPDPNNKINSAKQAAGGKTGQPPVSDWIKKQGGKKAAAKKVAGEMAKKATTKLLFSKPVLIALGIVAVILFCLFIVYYIYAVPSSLTKTISYKSSIERMEESGELTLIGIQAIGDFIISLNPFSDSATSDDNLKKANVKIPVEGEDYDADNDFDVVLIEEYKLIAVALSKAYDQALEDIDDKASSMGYDGAKTVRQIKQKYPNGWKDIYKDINYGTLIAVFSYQIQDSVPNWSSANLELEELMQDYKSGSINGSFYERQLKEIKDVILDEDNAKHFYHANFSIAFQEEGKEPYLEIELLPFSLLDLYELIDIDPDEDYDDINTYAEMQDVILSGLKMCSENADGTPKPIHKTLGLDNENYPWNYTMGINDISKLYAYQKIEENENANIVYSLLRMMGYNEVASSGICGNLEAEHKFSTAMEGNSGSVGIAQWKGGRKENLIKYAEQLGLPVTSIYAQGLFLIHELESNPVYYHVSDLKNASSVEEATDIFCIYFERPNNYASKEEWKNSSVGKPSGNTYLAWERFNYSSISGRYHIDLNKRRGFALSIYATNRSYPILNWPVPDSTDISNSYKTGGKSSHYGIDISASKGARVYTAGVGTVTEVGNNSTKGNYVVISHFNRYTTEYYHLNSVSVSAGDFVTLDTMIGTVGDTGNAKKPHLHFGVRNASGTHIAPLTVIDPNRRYESSIDVISIAESLVGKIVYEWGSKPTNAGWNERWNSGTTGLDCSGFVQWVYWTATGTKTNGLGSTWAISSSQEKIGYSDLQPGDLGMIFDGGTYYLDATGVRFPTEEAAQASNNNKGLYYIKPITVSNHVGIFAGKDEEGKDIWIHCTGGNKDTVVKENYTRFKIFYRVKP